MTDELVTSAALIALIGALLVFLWTALQAIRPTRCSACGHRMLGWPRYCPRCGTEL